MPSLPRPLISTKPDPHREFATEVVTRLQQAGFQALWAGGCVRDLVLDREPSDYDVATDATPDVVMRLFRRTVPVGVSFGVVRVLGPRGAREVEVATFRTDGRYLDGRRPESVTFGTARDDASRRDFTINGMFLDPLRGEVLDFVGGREDLRRERIRSIGDPFARFTEDKLRLLRAVRFAARFGFDIEPATRAAIESMADQVRVVAAERLAQELEKILVHPSRATGMGLAMDTGLVAAILPEVVKLRGLPQDDPTRRPHHDVWKHTRRVLAHLLKRPSFPLALAALLHDVGKTIAPGDHEAEGAHITDRIARRLKLSNADRERTSWLVAHHHALRQPETLRRSRLKSLLAAPGANELLKLERAHTAAIGVPASHVAICERYRREQPDGPLDPPPLITGNDLIQLGLKPGPRFKELLDQVRERQLDNELIAHDEAIEWVRRQIRS